MSRDVYVYAIYSQTQITPILFSSSLLEEALAPRPERNSLSRPRPCRGAKPREKRALLVERGVFIFGVENPK